jgi:hypothetical protein
VTPERAATFGGLLLALAVGRPLGAQERAVLELGVSYVRFPQDTTSVLGPSARWMASRERGRFATSGSLAGVVSASGASAYADAASRWLAPLAFGVGLELGGEVGGLLAPSGRTPSAFSTSTVVSSRLLRAFDGGGLWLRGSGNIAKREAGALWGRGIDAGGWWRRPGLQLVGTLTREWSVAQLFTGPGREGFAGVVPVHYVEGNVGIQVDGNETSLALTGTVRRDPGAERLVEPGFSATATFWRTPTQALLVNVSRQLPDFVHGAEASQSVTVGIRLNEPSPLVARAMRARPFVQVGSADSAASADGAPPRRTLRVRAPAVTRVEVMGDFTGWEPVALAPTGDVFSATFTLSTGSHRMVLRLDGGAWLPAANTPAVDDDFGGRVGLLLVQ